MENFIPATQWSAAILPILDEGNNLKIPLSGRSMFPLLSGGRDEAIISTVKEKKLKRGHIVLYARDDGTHVLHRIHHIKNGDFFMLGDAHTFVEGPIKKENVLAIAVAVVRKGKMISCSRYDFRIVSALWMFVRPMRAVILRVAISIRHQLKQK